MVEVSSFSYMLQRWLPCLFPLVSLAGLLVCIRNRRLSPHIVLLILSFAGELVFGLMRTLALTASFLAPVRLMFLFTISAGGSLGSGILVIIGLAQVLADVRRRLAVNRQGPDSPGVLLRTRLPDEADLRSWRERQEDSPHIRP